MAGYAVSGRIQGVTVQVGRGPDAFGAPDGGETHEANVIPLPREEGPVAEDLIGRPFDVVLEERLAGIREAWAMTTFFLFDPEGWR